MKATELRIGNWINDGDGDFTVSRKTLAHVETFPNKFKPIPLTEEWLVKLGFEKDEMGYYYIDDEIYSFVDREQKGFMLVIAYVEYKETYIKHVHQLQNLYFALIGEELTIKE